MSDDSIRPDEQQVRETLSRLRREQERLVDDLLHSEHRFRRLARSVWRVQEDERRRLARELHDGLGQNLAALRHRLDALGASLPSAAEPALAEALSLCERSIEETRSLSRLLRPQILDDLGLEAALRWLVRSCTEHASFEADVSLDIPTGSVDAESAILVYRIAQEALNNIGRHAQARHIALRVGVRNRQLRLTLVDDGVGCDMDAVEERVRQGHSTGLASMRERVRLFGGRVAWISAPGEGMQVRVTLPLEDDES